jgi:hypothetical protein
MEYNYGINRVWLKIITVFMAATSFFPVKTCGSQAFYADSIPLVNNGETVFALADFTFAFPFSRMPEDVRERASLYTLMFF